MHLPYRTYINWDSASEKSNVNVCSRHPTQNGGLLIAMFVCQTAGFQARCPFDFTFPSKFQSASKKILAAIENLTHPPKKKDVHISSPKTFNKLHDYHPDGAWLSSGWGRSRQESCEEKLDRHKAMVFWVPLGHHLGDPFLHRQVRKASSWEKDWWTIHPRNHFSHLQSI